MKRIILGSSLIAAGLFAGCRPGDAGRPPTVRYGEEACASCRMIIGDEHFAAALVGPSGDALKFDDIGCLIEHEGGRLRPELMYWVRDAGGRNWLDARRAWFVHSPGVVSPMGFGLEAHPSERPAAEPAGRVLALHDLPDFLAERSREARSDRPGADPVGRGTASPRPGAEL